MTRLAGEWREGMRKRIEATQERLGRTNKRVISSTYIGQDWAIETIGELLKNRIQVRS